jgi:hypothetical protein
VALSIPFEPGSPQLEATHAGLARLRILADELDATASLERASGDVRVRFEEAATRLRTSGAWADVRVEAGRTKGYRFVHLVLRPSHARTAEESFVIAVTMEPAEVTLGSSVSVRGDISGEESGRIYFEVSPSTLASPFSAPDAAVGAAEVLLDEIAVKGTQYAD